MATPLRAAVVGGSGFGKFHAQWYAAEGAEVVAFMCTTVESAQAANGPIRELTGQTPCGYTDVSTLLSEERPDVVSICTPPAEHAEPTLAALESGAHVLCEKPLIFDESRTPDALLETADAMTGAAGAAGKMLAVNLQYAALWEPFLALYEREWGALESIASYEFDMESKGNRRGPNHYQKNWIELGPHVLTLLLSRLPTATLDEASIRATMSETEIRVELEMVEPGGHRVPVKIRTACCAKDATPVRRLGINGFSVDVSSRRDESGTFRTFLHRPGSQEEEQCEDLMQISIRRFLAAARGQGMPLVTGEEARRNLTVLLTVLERLQA